MSQVFKIKILGSSAAIPTSSRHTTAQLLQHHNKRFLLDCAEGTQMQLRRFKLPLTKIDHVFISHLHGDHFLGLPGLLFSLHLLGRTKTMHLYSPPGLEEIIATQYRISQLIPSFEIQFHELHAGGEHIYDDENLTVHTIAMEHRIPTYGFLFSEKQKEKNIRKEAIATYKIRIDQMPGLKKGEDLVTADGTVIPNHRITNTPPPPRSYAFCSDTAYTETFIDQIKGVDVLYHEATFLHDRAGTAREKMHSTALEAATLAQKAGAGRLLLGHYSARYKEVEAFRDEACTVFPNTFIAREGEEFYL